MGGGEEGGNREHNYRWWEYICTMHDDENVTKQWLDLVGHEVTLEKMCFKRLLEHRSRNTRTIDPVSDTYLNVLLYLYTSFSWLLCLSAFLSSEMFFPLWWAGRPSWSTRTPWPSGSPRYQWLARTGWWTWASRTYWTCWWTRTQRRKSEFSLAMGLTVSFHLKLSITYHFFSLYCEADISFCFSLLFLYKGWC